MSRVLTNEQNYYDIADTIRQMKNVNTTYKPRQMASALKDIYSNEVEGTLPLSFEANGNNLLDYRIDGASGGVGERTSNLFDINTITTRKYINNVGVETSSTATNIENYLNHSDYIQIVPSQNYTFACYLDEEESLNNTIAMCWFDINKNIISRNTSNININTDFYSITATSPSNANFLIINFIGLVEGAKFACNEGSTSLPYEPYGYKVPVVVSGKNLFDEVNAVVTDYYITNAGQENVGANGDKFLKSYINVKPSTQYTFKWSQTIMGSADNTPYIRISEYTSNNTFIQRLLCQCSAQSQNNYTFTTSNNTLYIDIRIDSETSTRGQHITEIMLVKGATAPDTYEEYTATTTNIYLDEPIEANESISLSDTNTNIPTIDGTNTLTINTTIQPSNVYIQAPKDSIEATIIASELEEI